MSPGRCGCGRIALSVAVAVLGICLDALFSSHKDECGSEWCNGVSDYTDAQLRSGPEHFLVSHTKTGTYLSAHMRFLIREAGLPAPMQCASGWNGSLQFECDHLPMLHPDFNDDALFFVGEPLVRPWRAILNKYWKPSVVIRRWRFFKFQVDASRQSTRVVNIVRDPYHQLASGYLYVMKGQDRQLNHMLAKGVQGTIGNEESPIHKCQLDAEWFSECLARLSTADALRATFDYLENFDVDKTFTDVMQTYRVTRQSPDRMLSVCLEELSSSDPGLRSRAIARVIRFLYGDQSVGPGGIDIDSFLAKLGRGEGHSVLGVRDGGTDGSLKLQKDSLRWQAYLFDQNVLNGTLGRNAAELGCAKPPTEPIGAEHTVKLEETVIAAGPSTWSSLVPWPSKILSRLMPMEVRD